jgi:hypothetical protein
MHANGRISAVFGEIQLKFCSNFRPDLQTSNARARTSVLCGASLMDVCAATAAITHTQTQRESNSQKRRVDTSSRYRRCSVLRANTVALGSSTGF